MNAHARRRKWLTHRWRIGAVLTLLVGVAIVLWTANELMRAR